MKKIIKKHLDNNFIKSFRRYVLIDCILDSNNWIDLEGKLKEIYPDDYRVVTERIFNELKFYKCVLKIEYAITDSLNNFLIKNNKLKWGSLKDKFLEKIERNIKCTEEEAKEILKKETGGKNEGILTPHMMLYCAGFSIGELIGYLNSFTENFSQKSELVDKLTEFNKCRNLIIHNLLTSREDADEEIKKGILLGKKITALIDGIVSDKKEKKYF